jgi:hypothetical protein
MRVLVEAACLTWIEVDTSTEQIDGAWVHALPENILLIPDAEVIVADPDTQELLTDDVRIHALRIAGAGPLPAPILRR